MRSLVIALGAALIAFALGILYQRGSQPDLSAELRSLKQAVEKEKRTPAAAPPTLITSRPGISREELREEMRSVLLEERATQAERADQVAGRDGGAPEEALSEQAAAFRDEASSVLDVAITRGV